MRYVILWGLLWAIIGSFGTAYLHERTGRNISMGGLIGFAVGMVGQIFLLVLLWVWIYYFAPTPIGRIYGRNTRWFRWWSELF
jgi:hypothetical protein